MGVGRTTISKLEQGKGITDLRVLIKICNFFNCELGYLLCEYDCKARDSVDIGAITGLSEEAIKILSEEHTIENPYDGRIVKARTFCTGVMNYMIENGINEILDMISSLSVEKFISDANMKKLNIPQNVKDRLKYIYEQSKRLEKVGRTRNLGTEQDFFWEIVYKEIEEEYKSELKSERKAALQEFIDENNVVRCDGVLKNYRKTKEKSDFDNEVSQYFYHLRRTISEKEELFAISDTFLDLVKSYVKYDNSNIADND